MLANVSGEQPKFGANKTSRRLFEALYEKMGSTGVKFDPEKEAWFRLSGIGYMCPREYYFSAKTGEKIPDKVGKELDWIFSEGHAHHHRWQNYLMRKLGDVFQGWWRCTKCGKVHKGERLHPSKGLSHKWIPRPEECRWCHAKCDHEDGDDDTFEYVELEFLIEDLRVTGHLDGILVWPGGEVEAMDLKTISSRGFVKVDPRIGGKPKPENVEQLTGGYGMILKEVGVTKARLVYILKEEGDMKNRIWEHELEITDESTSAARDKILGCHKAIEDGKNDLVPPERLTACDKKSSYRAKRCSMKNHCFACG